VPHLHLHLRGEHPHAAAARRGLAQGFWALVAGVVVAYVFFLALGAFGWAEAGLLTIAVIVLALLWAAHVIRAARASRHDPRVLRQRERRGF
jgi:ABC-type transport system involved in cytochrome bd biosynthesis fused ATPase/permease subunit